MKIDNSQIYEIYKNRLLDLSGRNKLISFKLTSKAFDMFSLIDFNIVKIIEGQQIHISQKEFVDVMLKKQDVSSKNADFQKEEYLSVFSGYMRKFNKLSKDNQDNFRESGKHSLYLCYYFMSGKLYGDNVVKFYAPLFLIPVDITTTMTSVKLKRSDDDILINRTILLALMRTLKNKIDIQSYEISQINENILLELLEKIEGLGLVLKKDFQFSKFPLRTTDNITDRYSIHNHLVLGNLNIATALFDDYERIGGDVNTSVQNLLNENILLNKDCEQIKREYDTIHLTNRELSLISKLDTSQELAVYMAKQSNNLVIYGPPGTGKSETILNIIADSIARNKKVLVVSEKKAAINVLYNRLMELQKIAIMFDASNKKLKIFKSEIDSKLRELHIEAEKCDLQTSLNKLEECYCQFNGIFDLLNTMYKGRKISEWYGEKKVNISNFPIDVEWFGSIIYRNPQLRGIFNVDYSEFSGLLERALNENLIKTFQLIATSEEKLKFFNLLLEQNIVSQELIYDFISIRERQDEILEKLQALYDLGIDEQKLVVEKDGLQNLSDKQASLTMLQVELHNENNLLSTQLNLLHVYQELQNRVASISSFDDLVDICNWGETTNVEYDTNLVSMLNELIAVSREYFDTNANFFQRTFNKAKISSLLTDMDVSKNNFLQKCNTVIANIDSEVEKLKQAVKEKETAVHSASEEINSGLVRRQLLNDQLNKIYSEIGTLQTWILNAFESYPNISNLNPDVVALIDYVKNVNSYIDMTKIFKENKDYIIELVSQNAALFNLYQALQTNNILGCPEVKDLLWKIYLDMQIENIGHMYESELKQIRMYEQIQSTYLEYENIYFKNNRQEILSKVFEKRKDLTAPDDYCLKERNFNKSISTNRKDEKLRQFMNTYFEVIQNYFPIILATPDAVSKYLPLSKDMFDIVVFDEASQLVIENALPAIYRGKKIIVVGDDKQLQPSSFFQKKYDVEQEAEELLNEDETIEELFVPDAIALRSLLDVTKGKYNSVSLLFHYRSKFAELIDFSNAVFYKGQLKLAPNVQRENLNNAITRIFVDGEWHNNSNEQEAQAVVKLLKQIFTERRENETIGIVTFNIHQKACIEDAIDREMMRDSVFKSAYNAESNRMKEFEDESIFIKNIENVQGDERDIIIFSVGYARDDRGRLVTSFGPLSQDGGENRLNVAVSRAKKKIYLITSFEPEELDVENTKNEGPKVLKDYLLYVKYVSQNDMSNKEALLSKYRVAGITKMQAFDSPFEEQVYQALTNLGYIVDTQVGCYGFRIDMAIYDENKGKYILGIECDGAAYHSSKNAKDRDIARQAFLESCGWKIYRIWSTSWWKEQAFTIEKLQKAINEAMNS